MTAMLGAWPASRLAYCGLGWLAGPGVLGRGDPDLLATLDAEDAFDLHDRLAGIAVPVLIVAGSRDAFYSADLFRQTAALIPRGSLVLHHGRGHLGAQARGVPAETSRSSPDRRVFANRHPRAFSHGDS